MYVPIFTRFLQFFLIFSPRRFNPVAIFKTLELLPNGCDQLRFTNSWTMPLTSNLINLLAELVFYLSSAIDLRLASILSQFSIYFIHSHLLRLTSQENNLQCKTTPQQQYKLQYTSAQLLQYGRGNSQQHIPLLLLLQHSRVFTAIYKVITSTLQEFSQQFYKETGCG